MAANSQPLTTPEGLSTYLQKTGIFFFNSPQPDHLSNSPTLVSAATRGGTFIHIEVSKLPGRRSLSRQHIESSNMATRLLPRRAWTECGPLPPANTRNRQRLRDGHLRDRPWVLLLSAFLLVISLLVLSPRSTAPLGRLSPREAVQFGPTRIGLGAARTALPLLLLALVTGLFLLCTRHGRLASVCAPCARC